MQVTPSEPLGLYRDFFSPAPLSLNIWPPGLLVLLVGNCGNQIDNRKQS